jgi:hypothetical protein
MHVQTSKITRERQDQAIFYVLLTCGGNTSGFVMSRTSLALPTDPRTSGVEFVCVVCSAEHA